MAQTFVYNTNELSPQGYLKPANTVSAVSPDNVTHLQLRYSDFSSSYVIQGSVVSGENSTFEFSIADNLASEIFKMYYSTDGTTYNVDKTFGGTSGKKLFATADLSGLVTTGTAQNITATKTLTTNANLVVSSGSDITVQSGGDITLADAPTASTDATNKAYVDGLIGYTEFTQWVNQDGTNAPGVGLAANYTVKNNTGRTWTWSYLSVGNYRLTPSGTNPFNDQTNFHLDFERFITDGLGTLSAWVDIDYAAMVASGVVDITVVAGDIGGPGIVTNSLLTNWRLTIRLFD